MTVAETFRQLARHPSKLWRQWNWKAAGVSAAIRAGIYLVTNLRSGWRAGLISMLVEAVYRVPLSGFCGAFTQSFRNAQPRWAATLTVMVCLPLVSHSLEFFIHWLQGAPYLKTSLIISISFTILASLFNLYAMRRGALLVGGEAHSAKSDFRQMPAILLGFMAAVPMAIMRWLGFGEARADR